MVSRQPLDGLKIARPLALIDKPRHGYVMELMDGLEPLQHLLGLSLEASKTVTDLISLSRAVVCPGGCGC
jgi:hypothetical protein